MTSPQPGNIRPEFHRGRCDPDLAAAWRIPLTIYRLLTVGKGGGSDFHFAE